MNVKTLIALTSSTPGTTYGTDAPFAFGKPWIGRIGFANIPVVGVNVFQRKSDHIVAVVRQHVYRVLRERGLPYNPDTIDIRPLVGFRRDRVIVDENKSSPSFGKRKRLTETEFTFEILQVNRFCQAYGNLPSYRESL